jgi:predicted nucleic acid-binding protein
MNLWYVDTTIMVAVITGRSAAGRAWFDRVRGDTDTLMASRLMEVELRHIITNLGGDHHVVDPYLGRFVLYRVDDALMSEAINIPGLVRGADSIHIATAARARASDPIIVTHDGQFARAASAIAFDVRDPITDDPGRPPVAKTP